LLTLHKAMDTATEQEKGIGWRDATGQQVQVTVKAMEG